MDVGELITFLSTLDKSKRVNVTTDSGVTKVRAAFVSCNTIYLDVRKSSSTLVWETNK